MADDVRLQRARIVAEHWREGAVRERHHAGWAYVAHVAVCILASLDGEDDPQKLGITPGTRDYDALEALR